MTSRSFNYSVVLIKHIYAPVIGDIRMDKRSEDPVLIKHMFWGEKTTIDM